jgi:hypothetical protein
MKKLAWLALIICLISPRTASAQGDYQAVLSVPDISAFPSVTANLNIHAPDGSFIHGLDSTSVQILEDGQALKVNDIQEVRIGLQISVVINTGTGFGNRNAKGVSRYDYLKQYLQSWAQSQKEIGIDDLSLFTNGGVNQTHLRDSQAWLTALATYQPDLKNASASLEPLQNALKLATDTGTDQPVGKAIFYVTPLPGAEMTEAVLNSLIGQAKDSGVHIFVWMLAARTQFTSPEAGYLRSLAEQTGGQFFAFSGTEPFPEAQSLVEPLRYLYQVGYTSHVKTGGRHNLAVKVLLKESTVTSIPAAFEINLQPPTPIFVGLPASITRTAPEKSKDPLKELSPGGLAVEFLVEYPDNLQRELASSRLLVDGKVEAENKTPPFTRFQWDISPYTSPGKHTLQIEITDNLGITNQSNSLPVEIKIVLPQKSSWQQFLDNGGQYLLLFGGFILGIAVALIFLRVREGRRIPPRRAVIEGGYESQALISKPPVDLLDQTQPEEPVKNWYASLQLVDSSLQSVGEPPIRLSSQPITWGSDQSQATIWMDDKALEAVHCRLWFAEDQRYYLADNQSAAGTWVNYGLVSEAGVELKHGDIIRIGDLMYRYEENPPQLIRKIEVKPYNITQ